MWVGTTYYFPGSMRASAKESRRQHQPGFPAGTLLVVAGQAAQIWMVTRRFLRGRKRSARPRFAHLHWFRWEAGTTWLSSAALLIVVYYIGGGAMIDPDVKDSAVACYQQLAGGKLNAIFDLSLHYYGFVVALGCATLVVGWLIYDLLMISALGKTKKLLRC